MICFTVDYEVVAKQGDRSFYNKALGRIVHAPNPKTKRNSDDLVALCAQHRPEKPLVGPVCVTLSMVFPWPKSMSKRQREACDGWKDTRPDWDNLSKQVCDVLQRCGFFLNDAQIAKTLIAKQYGDRHRLTVTVDELSNKPNTEATATNGKAENAQLPLLV